MTRKTPFLTFLIFVIPLIGFAQNAIDPFSGKTIKYSDISQGETANFNTYQLVGVIKPAKTDMSWFFHRQIAPNTLRQNPIDEKFFLSIEDPAKPQNSSAQEVIEYLKKIRIKLTELLPNVVFIQEKNGDKSKILFGPFANKTHATVIQKVIRTHKLDTQKNPKPLDTKLVFRNYSFALGKPLAILKTPLNEMLAVEEGQTIPSTPWLILKIKKDAILTYHKETAASQPFAILEILKQ